MQIINSLFYIILFTTVVGSIFTISALTLNRVFHIVLPLWFGNLGMLLYVFPILAPGLFLVSPEAQVWLKGYRTACVIWSCGILFFVLYHLLRTIFAHRAMAGYQACNDEHISAVCAQCAEMTGLKNVPMIYFGTLDDIACVTGVLRPAIIINKNAVAELTETQLMAVLEHEVIHIKRGHMISGKIFNQICVLNWLNPMVWVARKEFDVLCEIDCDKNALMVLKDKVSDKEYALTMLHCLELSAVQGNMYGSSLSVTGFLLTRRRIVLVMNSQSGIRSIISTILLIIVVTAVICFSVMVSRGHFYPYPAYSAGIEYSYIGF